MEKEKNDTTDLDTYEICLEAKKKLAEYQSTRYCLMASEKSRLETLLESIRLHLKTYQLREYQPFKELSQPVIDRNWEQLYAEKKNYSDLISIRIKE